MKTRKSVKGAKFGNQQNQYIINSCWDVIIIKKNSLNTFNISTIYPMYVCISIYTEYMSHKFM